MKTKKILLLLLCAALLMPAAACTGEKPAESSAPSSTVTSRQEPSSSEPAAESSREDSAASSSSEDSKTSSEPASSAASSEPEESKEESSRQETSTPESSKPAESKPESSTPASSTPASSKPESSASTSSKPESSTPTSSKPEESKPESSKPETDVTDLKLGDDLSLFAGTPDGKAPYAYKNSRMAKAMDPMVKNEKMHMKGNLYAMGFAMTVEMHTDHDKSYVSAKMMGKTMVEVVVPGDGNVYYYSFQTPKTYTVYTEEEGKELTQQFGVSDDSMKDATVTESGTIRLNGTTYYYEKMETESGVTIAYFDGNKLFRVDVFSAQKAGGAFIKQCEMTELDDKVNEKLFVLHSDYALVPHTS